MRPLLLGVHVALLEDLFILYHLVPVWLGRTVHHVGEAVLLGSMHLLLASGLPCAGGVHGLVLLVPSVGLLWWLLHKMELVGATLKLVSSMDWWPGTEACWPSCRAGSHCGERVSWALRMERSGGHQLP